jgi:predicted nuclease of predicted toxin-antitoxin system
MKFYADVHISKKAVEQLKQKGVDIIHCDDADMADAKDLDHLVFAAAEGRIIVTCDVGFIAQWHWAWIAEGKEHSGILYLRAEDECKDIGTIVKGVLKVVEDNINLYNTYRKVSDL